MADVLNPDALHHELARLEGWDGTTGGIRKAFAFPDEASARSFLDRVSALADQLDHHPDVTVHGGDVTMNLVTHSAGGVTQRDVELARRIDPLAIDEPPQT